MEAGDCREAAQPPSRSTWAGADTPFTVPSSFEAPPSLAIYRNSEIAMAAPQDEGTVHPIACHGP
jgi:hypothetical protein